jgi:hypothetical protein
MTCIVIPPKTSKPLRQITVRAVAEGLMRTAWCFVMTGHIAMFGNTFDGGEIFHRGQSDFDCRLSEKRRHWSATSD